MKKANMKYTVRALTL